MSKVAQCNEMPRRAFLTTAAGAAARLTLGGALPSQAQVAARGAESKRGGTFTLASPVAIQYFNPFHPVVLHLQRAFWNSLARYDSNMQLQPELAEKWDISPDGKSVTLKLREGVKYHSGREFIAPDVKANWAFASTDERSTMISMFKMIKQVETPSRYVAVLKFDTLYTGVYDLLDMLFIMEPDSIEKRWNTASGTGPFMIDKYVPNDRVEMVAFKDYWDKGKPYLDKYVGRIVPDQSALAINLEAGAVDCAFQLNYVDANLLKQSGGKFVVDTGAAGGEKFDVGINVELPPFTDKKVRQAIAWSIDRARFCKTVLQGLFEPSCLMWPPFSWAYFKDLEGKIGFDLDRAKALLKEAGLERGFETEILASTKRQFGTGDLAQIIAADLAKIGIKAKVVDTEPAVYNTRHLKGDIAVLSHVYGRANRDPGVLVDGAKAWTNKKQGNWTHWDNAEWDRLRAELNSTLDMEKRKATARKLQEMALDECFTIPVAPYAALWAYSTRVKGMSHSVMNEPLVGSIWLES